MASQDELLNRASVAKGHDSRLDLLMQFAARDWFHAPHFKVSLAYLDIGSMATPGAWRHERRKLVLEQFE